MPISRTLPMPRKKDLGEKFARKLTRRRKHKHKWPEPTDAEVILNLHFNVYTFGPNSYHADATLEVPTKIGFEYYSITGSGKTRAGALRKVIEDIEGSFWFHYMRDRHVRFRVTGAGMEDLYKGYL